MIGDNWFRCLERLMKTRVRTNSSAVVSSLAKDRLQECLTLPSVRTRRMLSTTMPAPMMSLMRLGDGSNVTVQRTYPRREVLLTAAWMRNGTFGALEVGINMKPAEISGAAHTVMKSVRTLILCIAAVSG